MHEEHVLSIPKNAIEILYYLQLVLLGSNMIFLKSFICHMLLNSCPTLLNKKNYTHGLTSKFMFWVWILTIVGEFDFRTKKKDMRLWKQSFKH
jgi:hypothetical protein